MVFGVVCTDHAKPFQRSASVLPRRTPPAPPTAVHAFAELQDTPLKNVSRAPFGSGAVSACQVDPFQRSTKPCRRPPTCGRNPTATHARGEVHDTPVKEDRGVGVRSMLHREPFQPSTSGRCIPAVFASQPTLMQNVREGHDTATSALSFPNLG